jgi:hypothetical protein
MDLIQVLRDGIDCIYLAQDKNQLKGSCERSKEQYSSIKFWKIFE